MTMQEKAIEQLERISRHLATIGEKEDYTGVAIQALERECEDCISREALLDKKWDVPSSNVVERKKIEKAIDEIQKLRGCSCSCSDGIIDDVEDILDKLIESEKSE